MVLKQKTGSSEFTTWAQETYLLQLLALAWESALATRQLTELRFELLDSSDSCVLDWSVFGAA